MDEVYVQKDIGSACALRINCFWSKVGIKWSV